MPEPISINADISIKNPLDIVIENKKKEAPVVKNNLCNLSDSSLDFLKWFLGTFIIGIVTIVVTFITKEYELKIAARTSENTYMNAYLSQYENIVKLDSFHKNENAKEMFDILYFATLDNDLRSRWDSVRTYLNGKKIIIVDSSKNLAKRQDSVQSKIIETSIALEKLKKAIGNIQKSTVIGKDNQITELKAQAEKLNDTIAESQKTLTEVIDKKLELDKFANKVLVSPPDVLPKASPNYELIYSSERFAAVGYFNQIIDGIILNIDSYNNADGSISIRISKDDNTLKAFTMKVADSQEDDYQINGIAYKIKISLKSYAARPGLFHVVKVATYEIQVERIKGR